MTPESFEFFTRSVLDCPQVERVMDQPCRPTPCRGCPFRKDRPVWLSPFNWLVNLFRLRDHRVQRCHADTASFCAGAVVAIAGGSPTVFNVAEFERIGPHDLARDLADAYERYNQPPIEPRKADA